MATNLIQIEQFVRHLKLEAVTLAILMIVLVYKSSAPLWVVLVTFPVFDIGMIGYMHSSKFGSLTYNILHNLSVPTLCIASGVFFSMENIAILGFCWTFHIAVDRALGFGLKQRHSFHATHLGKIGKVARTKRG